MNKSQLVRLAAVRSGLSQKDAERFLNALIDAVSAALSRGERVQLTGFGTFETKQRSAKRGRDPRTGEAMAIPAARVPVFRPSQGLRERVEK